VRRAFHTKSPLAGCSSITCARRSNAGSLDERRNQLGMRLRVAGTESSVYPADHFVEILMRHHMPCRQSDFSP
jgi:hypothetical protein